jgi:hypothetical protein
MGLWQQCVVWLLLTFLLWRPLSIFMPFALLKAMVLAFIIVRYYSLSVTKESNCGRLTSNLNDRE